MAQLKIILVLVVWFLIEFWCMLWFCVLFVLYGVLVVSVGVRFEFLSGVSAVGACCLVV